MATPTAAAPGDDDKKTKKKRHFLSAPSATYVPTGSGWWGAAAASVDGKPVFTPLDVPRMMRDPQVIFIADMWCAPFQRIKFKCRAEKEPVANFVQNTVRRFWKQSLGPILRRYFEYGFGAGCAEYRPHKGFVRLDRVREVECRDANPRVYAADDPHGRWHRGQFAGFDLTGGGAGAFVGPPHAFWFAGMARYGAFYDRAPLSGVFEPWLEKNGRNGANHLRQLWFRKHAADGGLMRYPDGTTNMGTDESPQVRNNADLARELLDYKETMSTMVLVNDKQPGVNGGGDGDYEWDYTPSQGHADVAGFLEYPERLDDLMLKGAGIPKELISGSESGSGYNGRMVPLQGFLGKVDELANVVVRATESWLRPLVEVNFGANEWYEVETVSLADQLEQEQTDKQKRSGELPAKPGAGGDLPFQLSALESGPRYAGPGWDRTEDGDYVRWDRARPKRAALSLSATDAGCAAKPHKFSSTHVILPPGLAQQLADLAAKVPDSALAEDGREDEFHVTVRYGLHTDSADEVREVIEDSLPAQVSLGGVSVFRGAESGKPYDVLKVDVTSPGLRALNRQLAVLPHTDTFKDYRPHATIAYVKAGLGDALAALAQPLNADFTASEVVFSNRASIQTVIPLTGALRPLSLAATSGPDDDPDKKAEAFNAVTSRLSRSRKSTITQLLALAMVRAQQRATAAGKPDAAAGSLEGLAELAGDPVQVARIVGMKLDGTEMSALELAWAQDTGPKGGTFWINSETGEKRYQKTKPGERKEKQEASEKAGWEIINAVAKRKATPEQVAELATHLPVMRGKELMKARAVIEANLRGERKKLWMVQRLLDHVATSGDAKEAIPSDLRVPSSAKGASRNPSKSKYAGTVTQSVMDFGGIDPNDSYVVKELGGLKQAVANGIPLVAFRSARGGWGTRGVDQMAQELQSSGHLVVPGDAHSPEEYLMEQILKGAKANGNEDGGEKAYNRRMKEMEDDGGGVSAEDKARLARHYDPDYDPFADEDEPRPKPVAASDKGHSTDGDAPHATATETDTGDVAEVVSGTDTEAEPVPTKKGEGTPKDKYGGVPVPNVKKGPISRDEGDAPPASTGVAGDPPLPTMTAEESARATAELVKQYPAAAGGEQKPAKPPVPTPKRELLDDAKAPAKPAPAPKSGADRIAALKAKRSGRVDTVAPKGVPAPVAEEVAKQVEAPAPKGDGKKPVDRRKRTDADPDAEVNKFHAERHHNMLLDAVENNEPKSEIKRLYNDAKRFAANLRPDLQTRYLARIEKAMKGTGEMFPDPDPQLLKKIANRAPDGPLEDVDPTEAAPTEAVPTGADDRQPSAVDEDDAQARAEAKALTGKLAGAPDGGPVAEDPADDETTFERAARLAERDYREAVAQSKSDTIPKAKRPGPATLKRLKAAWDKATTTRDAEARRVSKSSPVAGILKEEQDRLARLKAMKVTDTAEALAARERLRAQNAPPDEPDDAPAPAAAPPAPPEPPVEPVKPPAPAPAGKKKAPAKKAVLPVPTATYDPKYARFDAILDQFGGNRKDAEAHAQGYGIPVRPRMTSADLPPPEQYEQLVRDLYADPNKREAFRRAFRHGEVQIGELNHPKLWNAVKTVFEGDKGAANAVRDVRGKLADDIIDRIDRLSRGRQLDAATKAKAGAPKAPAKPKAGAPKALAPDVDALASRPLADKEQLKQFIDSAPTPKAKELLEDAEWNMGPETVADRWEPKNAGKAVRRHTVDQLGASWRVAHEQGMTAEADYLATVLGHYGARVGERGVGEEVPFDPAQHASAKPISTGQRVKVTRPAVVLPEQTGEYVVEKGLVEPV